MVESAWQHFWTRNFQKVCVFCRCVCVCAEEKGPTEERRYLNVHTVCAAASRCVAANTRELGCRLLWWPPLLRAVHMLQLMFTGSGSFRQLPSILLLLLSAGCPLAFVVRRVHPLQTALIGRIGAGCCSVLASGVGEKHGFLLLLLGGLLKI